VKVRDELQQLPAVGPSIAADLRQLGVKSVKDLARRDPERVKWWNWKGRTLATR
jgi:predicted flap endonuclease-1-like 5' DNA nuclease